MGISQQLAASRLIQPGVCTSTTRPASPYTGQCIYETDTNRLYVWNGSAWVIPNQTTQNPEGLEMVSNGTVTSSSSFQITGFSSTYSRYRLLIQLLRTDAVGGTTVYAQLYNGTTQRATGYYASAFFSSYLGTTGVGYTSNNSSNFFVFNADSGISGGHGFGSYDISGMNSTFNMNGQFWDVQNARSYTMSAYHNVLETNDRLQLVPSTGLVSGEWRLYGYRNS